MKEKIFSPKFLKLFTIGLLFLLFGKEGYALNLFKISFLPSFLVL